MKYGAVRKFFLHPLYLVEVSLDIAENESSICLRSIQHLATVFIFKVIGADIENVLVRRMLQVSLEVVLFSF